MTRSDPPRFGVRVAGCNYIDRPSAYAILRDSKGSVAVLRTPHGTFLPGGGLKVGESPELGVTREVAEECGFEVRIACCLGVAEDLLHSQVEQAYYAIHSTFFRVEVVGEVPAIEPDHILCWLPVEAACRELSRESQRWAVSENTA